MAVVTPPVNKSCEPVYCREEDEACPLDTGPDSCPLWRFVEADLPTRVREDLLDWLDADQVVN